MLAVAENLSFAEFHEKYGHSERAYEYWHGRAVPKGMPTWIHGLLQRIVMQLLCEAGYEAASEVELRIVENAHPKPDVIATKGEPEDPYPTKALEVVVEILSPDDVMEYVIEKCRAYQTWGFAWIYVVDPASRSLFQWTGSALEISDFLTTAPAARIWERLDRAKRQKPL
jgi:Uma2 family endonuclease